MRFKIFYLLALFCSLNAEEIQKEILVQLSSQEKLTPLYVGTIKEEKTNLQHSYISEIQSILENDFKYNGRSKLGAKDSLKEKRLSLSLETERFDRLFWKDLGVAHLIEAKITESKLSLTAVNILTGALKKIKDLPLTGNISVDRRQIHLAADAIHKSFFGIDGIASTRILYSYATPSKGKDKWNAEIWECDSDGANAHQITNEHSYCMSAHYLPGETGEFIYVSYKEGQPKIFIADIKEGKGKRLIDLRGNQLLPAISKDREKIAFICDAGGRADLFLQSREGEKPLQLFAMQGATQASPTFSPDGSQIAFVSDKDGSPRIYLIPAKAGKKRAEPKLITRKSRESSCPCWSLDGKKLAFSAKVDRVRQIWIYDFETGEERQLTTGPGNKENPSWAPDSLHLVFNSVDLSSSELYIININQPEAVQITRGSGKKHYPSWAYSKGKI